MDDADASQLIEEIYEKARRASVVTTPEAVATGECLFCAAPVPTAAHRWCDADCRGNWQKERDMATRLGKRGF